MDACLFLIIPFGRSVKGTINLWSLKTKRTELILDGHDGCGILAADFLPCGKVIRSVLLNPFAYILKWIVLNIKLQILTLLA